MQHRLVWCVSRTEDQQSWAPSASDDEVGFALGTSWNPSTLIQNDAVQTLKLNLWTLAFNLNAGLGNAWVHGFMMLSTANLKFPSDSWDHETPIACLFFWSFFGLRQWRHMTWTDFLQPSTVSSRERVKPMAWSTKDHCHNHTCLPDSWKLGSYRWSLHCGGYAQLSSYFFLQFLL